MKLEPRMRLRLTVADENIARFYDTDRSAGALRLVGEISDARARMQEQDLVSDRPGRVFDRAAPSPQRRACVSRHGTAGERSKRKHAAGEFARRVVLELERARRAGEFNALVLAAGPPFLGRLRSLLPAPLRRRIAVEIPKDWVHQRSSAIRTQLVRFLAGPVK